MKKIIIIFVLFLLSCSSSPPKYQRGDVVYIKPDSTCGIVKCSRNGVQGHRYEIKLENGEKIFVLEKNIH